MNILSLNYYTIMLLYIIIINIIIKLLRMLLDLKKNSKK